VFALATGNHEVAALFPGADAINQHGPVQKVQKDGEPIGQAQPWGKPRQDSGPTRRLRGCPQVVHIGTIMVNVATSSLVRRSGKRLTGADANKDGSNAKAIGVECRCVGARARHNCSPSGGDLFRY